MSFLVEQKIRGKIYIYEAESYWDKEKKQPRQRRRYVGVKDMATGEVSRPRAAGHHTKLCLDFGVGHCVRALAGELGLDKFLAKALGDEDAAAALALAVYAATEDKALYLFQDWAESNWGMGSAALSSQDVSRLLERLGADDASRGLFWKLWARRHGAGGNVAFDITSISSYGGFQGFQEYGHNRDGESLPQVNVGLALNIASGLPLGYRLYPGSVTDVTTLRNLLAYLKRDLMADVDRLVLDRGFHSLKNLIDLNASGIPFLMPVPLGTKVAAALLKASERTLRRPSSAVLAGGRAVCHFSKAVNVAGARLMGHVYLDRAREADELARLMRKLALVEAEVNGKPHGDAGEVAESVDRLAAGLSELFAVELKDGKARLTRDLAAIDARAGRFGRIVLLDSSKAEGAEKPLEDYLRRDSVEKVFDSLKNEMDSGRARIHSQAALEGRLFVFMLGLVLRSAMMARLAKSELDGKLSFPEVVSALKRLRVAIHADGVTRLLEVTKKQRQIFAALGVAEPPEEPHGTP